MTEVTSPSLSTGATTSAPGAAADTSPALHSTGPTTSATSSAPGAAVDTSPALHSTGPTTSATSLAPGPAADAIPSSDSTGPTTSLPATSLCKSRISECIKELSPLPKAVSRVRKRKAQTAEILTSSPYKKALMVKDKDKKKKEEARKKKRMQTAGKEKKKKKRKQTVREDKPRGPKPKKSSKSASNSRRGMSQKREPSSRSSKLNNESQDYDKPDNYCAGCGEHVSESTSDWLQCRSCKLWYELECAGMLGKPQNIQDKFVCELCR